MPTNEERREAARNVRNAGDLYAYAWQVIRDNILKMPKDYDLPKVRESLARLIDPEKLGNLNSVKCPNCGSHATAEAEEHDWWCFTCDECGLEFGFDPWKYIPYSVIGEDWAKEWEGVCNHAD